MISLQTQTQNGIHREMIERLKSMEERLKKRREPVTKEKTSKKEDTKKPEE